MATYALPSVNQGNWTVGTHVGVDGGIAQYRPGGASQRTTLIDVTQAPYNADNTGTTSATAAIQSAVNDATAGQVIYLPAGTYRLTTPVFVQKNDVTVRGDGASTIIYCTGTGSFQCYGFSSVYGSNQQTLTGTRTKGTSVLNVADTSAYGVGELATVSANNETDNTRIQAGAPPTWSQGAYQYFRKCVVRVVAKDSSTITVDPPLPWDLTYTGGRLERGVSTKVERTGFEDFNFDFDEAAHPSSGLTLGMMINCWLYNVNVTSWEKNNSNGAMLIVNNSYKVEIRHCDGHATTASTSDGFLQPYNLTSSLIEDCIFTNWDTGLYSSGRTVNCAFLHNFSINEQSSSQQGFNLSHGGADTLNLIEGNIIGNVGLDGYHASAGQMTMHRNWFHGTNLARTLKGYQAAYRRFSKQIVHVGNIFGIDNWSGPSISLGNPNMGNANTNGGTANTTTGDFWEDWELTGTLTTRTSDTEGVVTVSGGEWSSTSGAGGGHSGGRMVSLLWNGRTSHRVMMTITARTDLVLTVSGGSGPVLPAEGTVFDLVQPTTQGFQERDLSVAATLTSVHNYESSATGTGGLVNPLTGGTTLANSYAYLSQPSWWPTSLTWPPINPNAPVDDYEILPAGYRYFNGSDAPSGSPAAPVITLDPSSQTVTEGANVTLTAAATGNPAPTWSWTKNGSPISGATSSTLSLTSVTEADEGSYVATATNSEGSDSSTAAVLTVNPSGIPSTNSIRLSRAPLYAATVST